ncbi:MAG: glycosyltransferase [Solirubrobacteraceae bacterium]
MNLVAIAIGAASLVLFGHALFSLFLMLYAWDEPEGLRRTAGPESFLEPQLSFSVLLPARNEEEVIGGTIARIWGADYPQDLLEVIVICQRDDPGTITAVAAQIARLGSPRVRLAVYEDPPFNKPRALTVGYAMASGDVVTIFDAEDDVHPDIFSVMNTVMVSEGVGVVQGGVALMNFRDHWFSVFNCLEYFFYFKSRLHFNARVGMVPLGGNTVFIKRELIDRVQGWDVGCLTEDADIGIRLSALGEPVRVVYDSRWVTREETPHSVRALVKQRTRWHQGFLQILKKGDWRRIPGWSRKLLALMILGQPILDASLLSLLVLMPAAILLIHLPVLAALLSLAPLYAVFFQMLVSIAGIIVFGRSYDERVPWRLLARMPLTYLPYQWLLAFSALRATVRHLRGESEWEKTAHTGAHRRGIPSAPGWTSASLMTAEPAHAAAREAQT